LAAEKRYQQTSLCKHYNNPSLQKKKDHVSYTVNVGEFLNPNDTDITDTAQPINIKSDFNLDHKKQLDENDLMVVGFVANFNLAMNSKAVPSNDMVTQTHHTTLHMSIPVYYLRLYSLTVWQKTYLTFRK
jgi:hypothetical protein